MKTIAAKFTADETRILQAALSVWRGEGDYSALSYEEWCLAEGLFDRLDACDEV